eukprot:1675525-Amphidinium_carterae.1
MSETRSELSTSLYQLGNVLVAFLIGEHDIEQVIASRITKGHLRSFQLEHEVIKERLAKFRAPETPETVYP